MPLTPDEKEALRRKIDISVDAFSEKMREKMYANIEKGDWSKLEPARLILEMYSQLGEVANEMLGKGFGGKVGMLHYLVNISNFTMMLAVNLLGEVLNPDLEVDSDEGLE